MTDETALLVRLEARVSDFERQMKRAERTGTGSFNRMRGGSRTATRQMETDMTRATSRINQSLASTSAAVGSFAKTFATGFAGGIVAGAFAGFTSGINDTVKGIATIGDEAKRAGLSMRVFQEWKFVAEQNRIGIDALVDGFKELSLRADEFIVTGKGSAEEAFTRLGYSATELKTKLKDPSALMLEIIGRMQNLDKAAQIRIADELFGGTGGEQFVQILEQGEAGIRKTMDRGHELGAVMDDQMIAKAQELDRQWQEITTTTASWFKAFAVGSAGVVISLAQIAAALGKLFPEREIDLNEMFSETEGRKLLGDDIYNEIAKNKAAFEDAKHDIEALRLQYDSLGYDAIDTATKMASFAAELDNMGLTDQAATIREYADGLQTVAQEYATGAIDADEFGAKIKQVQSDAETAFSALESVDGVSFKGAIAEMGKLGEVISGLIGLASNLKLAMPGALGQTTGAMLTGEGKDLLPPGALPTVTAPATTPTTPRATRGGGGASKDKDQYAEAVAATERSIAMLQAETAAFMDAVNAGEKYAGMFEYARKKAELLISAQQQGLEITPALSAKIEEQARAYAVAGDAAAEAAAKLRQIEDATSRGESALEGLFGSILDGADAAKQAFASLLAEIAKAQFIKGSMGLLNAMGGGGVASWLGGLTSYDGGGYTGSGSRTGGIDGKGGFLSIMHPRETVTDHTKGQQSQGNSSAAPIVNFHVDARGASEGVDAIIARELQKATPKIINQAVGAVKAAGRRGQ